MVFLRYKHKLDDLEKAYMVGELSKKEYDELKEAFIKQYRHLGSESFSVSNQAQHYSYKNKRLEQELEDEWTDQNDW